MNTENHFIITKKQASRPIFLALCGIVYLQWSLWMASGLADLFTFQGQISYYPILSLMAFYVIGSVLVLVFFSGFIDLKHYTQRGLVSELAVGFFAGFGVGIYFDFLAGFEAGMWGFLLGFGAGFVSGIISGLFWEFKGEK